MPSSYPWNTTPPGEFFSYPKEDHDKVCRAVRAINERRKDVRFMAVRRLWRCYALDMTDNKGG